MAINRKVTQWESELKALALANHAKEGVGRELWGNTSVMTLSTDELYIDKNYQRPISRVRIRKMLKDFRLDAVGLLYVSLRESGDVYVFDGQHRLEMLKIKNIKTAKCLVWMGLSLEDEAELFVIYNGNRGPVTALARFKGRLAYSEPTALEIHNVVCRAGFSIPINDYKGGGSNSVIQAVGAVERVFVEQGRENLERVLKIIREAYRGDSKSLSGQIILGTGIFLKKYGKLVDDLRLIDKLSQTPISELQREGTVFAKIKGHSSSGVAIAIHAKYNSRLTTNRLPDWA